MEDSNFDEKNNLIQCIFFSEFHPTAGPKITYQSPDYLSKEIFDSLSVYIIPKPELHGKLITVNALEHKILGLPMGIQDVKYPRNELIFNLCFVCNASARTVQYEPLIQKLATYLVNLELECCFLSNEQTKPQLSGIIEKIRNDLNVYGHCAVPVNESNTIYLKVVKIYQTPPPVLDHHVPIFCQTTAPSLEWDLTTQQILPYIDGFRHIRRIATEADVEISLVKACVQNMAYYGVVMLLPLFLYSNVYTATSAIDSLYTNPRLQEECIQYVSRPGLQPPSFKSVYMLYCGLSPGLTVKDLCQRHNPASLSIDERRLIQFGLMKGIIRRLQRYPVDLLGKSTIYTGNQCFDEICIKLGLCPQELEEKIERDSNIVICWK